MAIQLRRGAYDEFDPAALLPGELAVVTSGDPGTQDGRAVYACVAAGDAKRVVTADSVPPQDVQDGAVTTAKLADGAVTGAKLADGAVTMAKVAPGALATGHNLLAGRLERGTISTAGADAASNTRFRTRGYLTDGEECRLWVRVSPGYKFAFLSYDADGTLRADEYWYTSEDHGEFGFACVDGMMARVVVSREDEGAIADVSELDGALTVERHLRDRMDVSARTLTYGAIRTSNGANIGYKSYPNVCRTSTYMTFAHGTALLEVMGGFTARWFTYEGDGTFVSCSDVLAPGAHELVTDPTRRYRLSVARSGSSDDLSPAEANAAVRVVDGHVSADVTAQDRRLVAQLRHLKGESSPRCVSLVHFSDIHGDEDSLRRIVSHAAGFLADVDDVLCTGDLVDAQWSHDFDYWAAAGADGVLSVMGNHDEIADRSNWNDVANYKTMAECYERYMAPYVESWGVTYQASKTYWHKDYGSAVRLIALDLVQDYLANDAEQMAWFAARMDEARSAGLAVVVAEHFPPHAREAVPGVGAWYDSDYSEGEVARWVPREAWQQAVEDFKTAGGEFICWMTGHTHADLICRNRNFPSQIFLTVDTATPKKSAPYSDTGRAIGAPTQDLFNVVGFDTVHKLIRIVRIGAAENMFMQSKKALCVNYKTLEVVGRM